MSTMMWTITISDGAGNSAKHLISDLSLRVIANELETNPAYCGIAEDLITDVFGPLGLAREKNFVCEVRFYIDHWNEDEATDIVEKALEGIGIRYTMEGAEEEV